MAVPSNQAKWEYKVVKIGPSSSIGAEAVLNELGGDGWDLVAFQPHGERAYPGEGTFYFKRPRAQGLSPSAMPPSPPPLPRGEELKR